MKVYDKIKAKTKGLCYTHASERRQRKELKLQMDHINGVRNDHRLENLRIVCPNCHSQTETFGSKNKKKTFPSEERIIEVLKNTACITQAIRVLAINNVNHKKLQLIADKYEIVQKSS